MSNDENLGVGYKLGKLYRSNPKVIKGIFLAVVLFWSYGVYDDWATKKRAEDLRLATSLGFVSAEEMKSMNERGFSTKADFNNAKARKAGFKDFQEMTKRVAQGINSGKELKRVQEKSELLGFDSIEEMIEIQSLGFRTKAEKITNDELLSAQRFAEERLLEATKKGFQNVAEMKEALKFGYSTFDDYSIGKARWVNIFKINKFVEYKGGIYIDKHWFAPDQVKLREASNRIDVENFYIDKSSIRRINEEIKEAQFRSRDNTYFSNNDVDQDYIVNRHQINCISRTIRSIAELRVRIFKAAVKSEIEQSTGRSIKKEVPEHAEIATTPTPDSKWKEIDTAQYDKYHKALCLNNFSIMVDQKYEQY